MDKNIENINLFNKYENLANEAIELYSEKRKQEDKFFDNFLLMNTEYKKLARQLNRVVKISDKQQKELINVNEKLKLLSEEKEELIKNLEETNDAMKKLTQMKEKFLSVAGHDLKTPFTAILGYIEFILMDESLSPKNREFIKIIEDSAKTQLKYIQDILSILKIEAGEFKLKITKSSFIECINLSINLLDILAVKKEITIEHDNLAEIFKKILPIDIPKMTQVVNNLISNAIKFTKRGGKIKIDCFENVNKEFEFHCIDNGVGISKDKTKLLFTHYSQSHTYGTEDEAGTGLGLSICKKIINLHGGEIFVKSSPGKGSDFWFTLPMS